MDSFVKQYGLVVVYAIVGILIIGILYGVFQDRWKSVGAPPDGIKTDFPGGESTQKKPFLLVKNQKVKVGEKVSDVRKFATARDIDEEELKKEDILVNETEGEILNEDLSLDTADPAKSILEYKVTGKNGQSVSQNIIILID